MDLVPPGPSYNPGDDYDNFTGDVTRGVFDLSAFKHKYITKQHFTDVLFSIARSPRFRGFRELNLFLLNYPFKKFIENPLQTLMSIFELKDLIPLERLAIGYPLKINESLLIRLARMSPNLRSFTLYMPGDNVSSFCIDKMTSYWYNLQEARFDWCYLLTDNDLRVLCDYCPMLISISFYKCKQISKRGLHTIANTNPYIEQLDYTQHELPEYEPITGEDILQFVKNCGTLTQLWLDGIVMDNDDLIELKTHCPYLVDIQIQQKHPFSKDAICTLAGCKYLQSIYLTHNLSHKEEHEWNIIKRNITKQAKRLSNDWKDELMTGQPGGIPLSPCKGTIN